MVGKAFLRGVDTDTERTKFKKLKISSLCAFFVLYSGLKALHIIRILTATEGADLIGPCFGARGLCAACMMRSFAQCWSAARKRYKMA